MMDNSGSSSDDIRQEFDVPDKTKNKYWKTKKQLIEEIKQSVGTVSSGKKNLNVVVIGTSGCGKSSFINTALTSFREDNWKLYSVVGQNSGNITNITQHFKSFRADQTYYRENKKVLFPTFIDINGLENNNDGFNKAFLRALFDGKIKEDEQLTTLQELFKNPSEFKKKISSRPQYLKVDRIVVVASSDPNEPLATELFKCIKEVSDDVKGIPIFGVMTKKDMFRKNQQVPKRREDFLGNLGITANSFKWVQNYCPDIDRHLRYQRTVYPHIDVPVLSFINQVINPHLSRDYSNYVPSPCGRLIITIVSYFCVFIQIVIWLFLFVIFTTIFIYDDHNKDFCTAYDKVSKLHDFTLPNVNTFCKRDKYAGYYFVSLPIAVSLLLFIVPPLVRRTIRVGSITMMCFIIMLPLAVCTSMYYYHYGFKV